MTKITKSHQPDWVIEVDVAGKTCYINESFDGDPGRTDNINLAERYATENEARGNMNAIRSKYPNQEYKCKPLPS